ncbi:MAG: DUF2779 domain-containing protein [Planktomarina sp.]
MFLLTKTDFMLFQHCAKSFWLAKHRPDDVPTPQFSAFAAKLAREGYEVEAHLKTWIATWPDAASYAFQAEFEARTGLFARADMVRNNDDGSLDIYEVKSSTSIKRSGTQNHIHDACFQLIAAQAMGLVVKRIHIIHLNSDFRRAGDVDAADLLEIHDVTDEVRSAEPAVSGMIQNAMDVLSQPQIDETSCTCLLKSKGNHCDAFAHFNGWLPAPSIYDLPNLSQKRREQFVSEGRFAPIDITPDDVAAGQKPVLMSAHAQGPVIDRQACADWFSQADYPLYFLDYETYASAIPLVDDLAPHGHLPVQYSLHVKSLNGDLEHHEYLADAAALPEQLITSLKRHIGPAGSIITWNKSFENARNADMAAWYPEHAEFLADLPHRTIDLQDVFKSGYVDIAFGGSTSIKKVLPVLAPDLSYNDMMIGEGTAAMDGWITLLSLAPGIDHDTLRAGLLEYCKLDTYAMVRLFEEVERFA